jgi:hypothetical protein
VSSEKKISIIEVEVEGTKNIEIEFLKENLRHA